MKFTIFLMQTFRVTCVHIQNVQFLQIIQFSVDSIIKRRQQQEEFGVVIQELKLYHDRFCTYFRMSVGLFELLMA